MTPHHRALDHASLRSQGALSGRRQTDILKSLIRKEGVRKQLDRSQKLFRKGDAASHIALIEDGIVAISDGGECGQRQIFDFITADSLIASALLPDEPSHFTAECLTSTTVSVLSLSSVQRIIATEPELNRALVDMVFAMLDGAYARMSCMLCCHSTQRIALLLAYLHEAHTRSAPAWQDEGLPIKQVDLATAVGVTAPHLNQIIKKLKSKGIVDTCKGKIKVKNFQKLTEIIDSFGFNMQYQI